MTVKANVLRILPLLAILLAACTNPPPPPPPSDPMAATDDGGVTPAGSVDLAPGEDANFKLTLGTVPQSFDVIIAELVTDQNAAIELRNGGYWGIISSSQSRERFVQGRLGTVPPAVPASQGATPAAIGPSLSCQGPCIMFDPAGGSFYLRVVNTGGSPLSADVYLYGWNLDDPFEPDNDVRSGAAQLVDGESGALELLGDFDYWSVPANTDVTISKPLGIDVAVSVYDSCGLAVAGPYAGGERFSVFAGESVRVRASGEVAATAGYSKYFVTLDPFSGTPRPTGCQQATANQDMNQSVGSVNLSGSGQAVFVLEVPSAVRNRDILQIEISKDAGLEVLASAGGTVLYSSHSRDFFAAGSLGPFVAPSLLQPSAINVSRTCGGSCVLIEGSASEYVVRVTNDGSSGVVSLYAFGRDFDDTTEPANDFTSTAPVIAGDGVGAIEYVGDEDVWKSAFTGDVSFTAPTATIDLLAEVYNTVGQPVAGPYSPGTEFLVYADEYVLVRAADPSQAAVAGKSRYNLF
ncbi:MAG TPA: hypothetical protein VF164_06820 [Trueperaceae bacterium]